LIGKPQNQGYKILVIILMFVVVLSNLSIVFEDVEFTFRQFISDSILTKLNWIKENLVEFDEPLVFVVNGNQENIAPYIDYWRQIIGSYAPNALIYVGKINNLLKLKEPDFNNTQLQVFATRYFSEFDNVISSKDELKRMTIIVVENFYAPITNWDLEYILEEQNDGIYVVKDYTPRSGVLLIGNLDYSYLSGPWYGISRNWSLSGMVLEVYGNLSVNDKVKYNFEIESDASYAINMSVYDVGLGYAPLLIELDDNFLGEIYYAGSFSPRVVSFSLFLTEGIHSISVGPAVDGQLFINLDYIEIFEQNLDG